jgi:hypothetical protein
MFKNNYFCLLLAILLPLAILTGPVPSQNQECKSDGLYNYDLKKEYEYDYSTKTKLWINDVSDDAQSFLYLNATVLIQSVEPCRYQMKLSNVRAYAASISDGKNFASELEQNVAVFSIYSNGALSSDVKFNGFEANWSRNLKRGIISAFQLRSENDMKSLDLLNENSNEQTKSSVVYETDLFGKCRTTYKLRKDDDNKIEIVKKKALHRCSLEYFRTSPVQADEYKSVAVSL